MKNYVYTTYDRVVGSYGYLSIHPNEAAAVRSFNHIMCASPMVANDCDLYCVGAYDMDTGIITSYPQPQFVCHYQPCDVPVGGVGEFSKRS